LVPDEILRRTIKTALASGANFAEVFIEEKTTNLIRAEEGKVERAISGRSQGAGIRVIAGEISGYAFTDELGQKPLLKAAEIARAIVKARSKSSILDLRKEKSRVDHPIEQPPETFSQEEKAAIVRRAEEAARSLSKEIRQVAVVYGDSRQRILIANSEGKLVQDERILTRLIIQVVARRGEIIQTALEAPGGQMGFELFRLHPPEETARVAAERALAMLDARPAPAGRMPVILESGSGGVLFHEACGHGLEADLVEKRASVYCGRLGERVASQSVTAIDDSTISNGWGSFRFDDEGTPAQKTVLIEEGILKGYLQSYLTAQKSGSLPTGNGRRQSYAHLPIPRMSNTYLAPGNSSLEEMIESTARGLYAKTLGGGQVDTASGDFVFAVEEGYLIEKGQITTPVRGATLVGNGPDVLKKIDLVAQQVEFRAGTCGKEEQEVPVATGQPALRIAELTVGGTEV